MALYLEQGSELSPEQLHDPFFEKALREDLVPICFCSAESWARHVPSCSRFWRGSCWNLDRGKSTAVPRGRAHVLRVAVAPDPSKHVIAHVFKIAIDPFVGSLASSACTRAP